MIIEHKLKQRFPTENINIHPPLFLGMLIAKLTKISQQYNPKIDLRKVYNILYPI